MADILYVIAGKQVSHSIMHFKSTIYDELEDLE